MGILDSIHDMLTTRTGVQIVADDPHMASEMLLLVRMMFADGELTGSELDMFKQMCVSLFHIPIDDVADVIRYLKDFGYETSGEQAALVFDDMPDERRRELLGHMLSIARADDILHIQEVELLARVAGVLGYTPEQVQAWVNPQPNQG